MTSKKCALERCVFCNSASHKMTNCNSNMNGRRTLLDSYWDCMMHEKCPDFNSFARNELRYIAFKFVQYEKAIHSSTQKTSQHYNRKYVLRPISLLLPKQDMVNTLCYRWNEFQSVRELSKTPPAKTEDDDCPICMECITPSTWSYCHASWVINTGDKIVTECNHSFCKSCWDTHFEKNSIFSHRYNYSTPVVRCPMCRHEIHYA
jgi:hypothetical protein